MDSINIEKIQALRKTQAAKTSKNPNVLPLGHSNLWSILHNPILVSLSIFLTQTFLCVSLPRVLSLFFNAKSLFILGNLIVIFLVRDSKGRLLNDPHNNRNNHLVKTTVPNKVGASTEVKMYTVFSWKSSKTDSERLSERRTYKDLSLKAKIGCMEEMARYENLRRVGRKTKQEEEELCQSDEEGQNLENSVEELMIPALSTDELRRRADEFIARVNKQIMLEANQVLVY